MRKNLKIKKQNRHIPSSIQKSLLQRSGGICECCGAAGIPDQHHLLEYSLGGPHILENLLLLCPSCHRQIPLYLTHSQQQELQQWHQNNLKNRISCTTTKLKSIESSIDIGTVLFKSVRTVLKVKDQNIITLHKEPSGIYMNIVMLEGFEPKLMILSNKVIVNDSYNIQISADEIIINEQSGKTQFVFKGGQVLKINGQVLINNEPFIFTENDGFKFRGINMRYTIIECAKTENTALTVNNNEIVMDIGGAKIIIASQK